MCKLDEGHVLMKRVYQQCTYCIMDNATDNTIQFDANGECNYCRDVRKRLPYEYFPNETGKKKLDEMIAAIKEDCKNDEYDCVVGVSGGIDSSYILYLGYTYGLRMLALHINDGLDNPVATQNLKKLIEKTGVDYVEVEPDREEYADIMYSFFKASLAEVAQAQDNLIIKAIHDYCKEKNIKYSLDGSNIAHEGILERGDSINSCDDKFIRSVQERYGRIPIKKLEFETLSNRYLHRNREKAITHIRPLNYIDYNFEDVLQELNNFCGFEYYGGKHYECILTRFLQCYYLPEKFGIDKRKSHFSSLIASGQLSRQEALKKMEQPLYVTKELLEQDKLCLANYMNISVEEFERCISLPPVSGRKFPHSVLNELAPVARRLRKFIE